MAIREFIKYLSSHYSMAPGQATSATYALLESGAIAEVAYALRFMDTQVQAAVPLEDLDLMVRQLANEDTTAPPTFVPATRAETPEGVGIASIQLTATVPQGLALPLPGGIAGMRSAFSKVVDSARNTLRVSSPYIEQPGLNLVLHAFERAANEGVQLRLLTRIDNRDDPNMRTIMAILTLHELFGQRLGVRSFARFVGQGPHRLSLGGIHAKILVADETLAYVGSGELRDHALNHNFEMGVVVSDTLSISGICNVFDTMWDASSQITVEYCQSFVS